MAQNAAINRPLPDGRPINNKLTTIDTRAAAAWAKVRNIGATSDRNAIGKMKSSANASGMALPIKAPTMEATIHKGAIALDTPRKYATRAETGRSG